MLLPFVVASLSKAAPTYPYHLRCLFCVKELESQGPRRFPIDAERFWGPRTTVTRYDLTLPAGWHATLPKSVKASSVFGSYESTYAEENGVLQMTRTLTGATGVQPPEKLGDLTAWMRAVAADDVKFIVLTRGASSASGGR